MRCLPVLGEVVGVGHQQVDLADVAGVRQLVREVRPQVLVNAAAFTAVDKAEASPDLAMAINGSAPGVMAQEMQRVGGAIVHYSTDYVYDGTKVGPYTEDDLPDPLSAYGRSKLAGDRAVQASGAAHLIFRTSWVYGARGSNFLLTMLRLFKERPEVRVVDDQIGAPTWCRYIARVTAEVLRVWVERDDRAASSGIYHLTAGGSTSWFGFASAIRDRRYAGPPPGAPRLVPITTAEYPLPARRPANSLLSNDKLHREFAVAQTDWREQLDACMTELEA
jgi:dTDP-4-dehydrorhamnose reductase